MICYFIDIESKSEAPKATSGGLGQLQNASQWGMLAMKSGTSGPVVNKHAALDSFEQFKKQAKEKEERVSRISLLIRKWDILVIFHLLWGVNIL